MKFALVGEERQEAQPRLPGKCLVCDADMIAKCGHLRVWHWAHKGILTCDSWWESETPWHRDWKNKFPKSWQEAIHRSETGEKHIADVKTERGVVLEFQHSNLPRGERESRENFYKQMVWIVDGLRRVKDRSQFFASVRVDRVAIPKPLTFSFALNEGALLRDWAGSRVPVFFDFGDLGEPGDAIPFTRPVLWRLIPDSANGKAYLTPVLKTSFVDHHVNGQPLKGSDWSAYFERARKSRIDQLMQQGRWPGGFDWYMAKQQRAHRGRRF
jgi:hypothetical protein